MFPLDKEIITSKNWSLEWCTAAVVEKKNTRESICVIYHLCGLGEVQ